MRLLRTASLVVIAALVIALTTSVVAIIMLNNRNFALPEAKDALRTDELVSTSAFGGQDWIVFMPVRTAPTTGLIIYPGGFVDPIAYAPIARAIAAQGYQVVIDPMPLNLAVLGIDEATDVIIAFPNVSSWVIGGHSLGGAMAAEFVARHPTQVDGLALWAAYPGKKTDLRGVDIKTVSIYGDTDGVAPVADVRDGAARLPSDANFVAITGGNHTQFGWYGTGLQRGDNPASVGRNEQQQIVIGETLKILSSID